MSTLSSNLERIKNAVDDIREKAGGETIEEVAENVQELGSVWDYFDETGVVLRGGGYSNNFSSLVIKSPPFDVQYYAPDTGNITFANMFKGCPFSGIDMTKISQKVRDNNWEIRYTQSMFSSCSNVVHIEGLELFLSLINPWMMEEMFSGCAQLEDDLDLSHIDRSIYCYNLFNNCKKVKSIDIRNIKIDNSNQYQMSTCFYGCSSLENLYFGKDYGKGFSTTTVPHYVGYCIDLTSSSKLTHESLMSVINNVYDIKTKGCNIQDIKLHADAYARLSPEEIQIATDKGWNVISA